MLQCIWVLTIIDIIPVAILTPGILHLAYLKSEQQTDPHLSFDEYPDQD